jgi:PDZ domain-containing protein
VAARRAGATVFLVPAGNCAEAAAATPNGLRLVRVEKLDTALTALEQLRTHRGSPVGCAS